ncbi:MAG TPA: glycosyltransferase family A protein [Longimicrobium sp.]|jgi:glycosyltransferase involved in cell wall biosynthesis
MFSVVIPLYNKERTIHRTVASVLAQTYRDFELIVVDDGSTDGSVAEVRRATDARLRLLTQANRGPGPARNAGIEAARHDWIAFLDGDDVWFPEHLAELDRIRTLHPAAGLIGTACVVSDREGRFDVPPAAEPCIEEIDYIASVGRGSRPLCASTAAIHRDVYRSAGGFLPLPSGQDSEYWVRIALARPVACSTRVTGVYVRGTGGITETAGTRWKGKPLRRLEDLSPAVARLLEHYPSFTSAARREAADLFVHRTLDWCIRGSVLIGDVETLRALPAIYPRPPRGEHRFLLAIARLPKPLARAAYRARFRAQGLAARLRRYTAIRRPK